MASISKKKRNVRRKPPILADYSSDDTEYPSSNQALPTLGSNQDGWRKITRGNIANGATVNNNIANATRHASSSSALANDLRNKRIRAELPHPPASINGECFNSSKRPSTLDVTTHNLRKNPRDEIIDEMGTHSLRGSDHIQPTNHVDNYQYEDPYFSDTETSDEDSNTIQGISFCGRGAYKGMDLDKLTDGRKNKLIVFIPPGKSFRPIGQYRGKLSNWLGYCSRVCGPPVEPWNQIERKHRHKLWAMVKDYFDVSLESPEKWKKLEETGKVKPDTSDMKRAKFEHFCFSQMQRSFGKWKHNLHNHYLRYANDKERLKHIPQGLSPDAWKKNERSLINSTNRGFQKTVTSTGPKPFAQVEYEMMDEELGELPKASDVWKATHGISDGHGQVVFRDSESTRVYEDMQRIEAQPLNDGAPVPTPDNVMQQVLGVRSGYARGKGFGYKASTKGMVSSGQNDEVNALKNEVATLTAELRAQEGHIKALEEHIKALEEQRKEQEERDRERIGAIMEQNKIFDSYCKRMDNMFELNSSRGTQDSFEEDRN